MSEWLEVVPWVLGAVAVTLGFLVFPGVPQPTPAVGAAPAPHPTAEPGRSAVVIDLAEFRQRKLQAARQ